MKKFNVILVSAILITLALTWFAFPMTANATTFQLDNTDDTGADTWLNQSSPGTNYDGDVYDCVRSLTSSGNRRTILKFNISSIPSGSTISSATLSLYYSSKAGDTPTGRIYYAYRLTTTDWVENSCTWNTPWTSAGGDYTETDGASATVPAQGQWMEWGGRFKPPSTVVSMPIF